MFLTPDYREYVNFKKRTMKHMKVIMKIIPSFFHKIQNYTTYNASTKKENLFKISRVKTFYFLKLINDFYNIIYI